MIDVEYDTRHQITANAALPALTGSPTEPRFPPIQYSKKSPREKEKAWIAETGRGRSADQREALAA
jgi:hypothetical protein